jgi:hypothetical protein
MNKVKLTTLLSVNYLFLGGPRRIYRSSKGSSLQGSLDHEDKTTEARE